MLTGSSAPWGRYRVNPPAWIPKGGVGHFILQDAKPSGSGSEGTATYKYSDKNLGVKTVTFSYECPFWIGNPNKASSSQAEWATWAKAENVNKAWSKSVQRDRNPLYVAYVIGSGQPH